MNTSKSLHITNQNDSDCCVFIYSLDTDDYHHERIVSINSNTSLCREEFEKQFTANVLPWLVFLAMMTIVSLTIFAFIARYHIKRCVRFRAQ